MPWNTTGWKSNMLQTPQKMWRLHVSLRFVSQVKEGANPEDTRKNQGEPNENICSSSGAESWSAKIEKHRAKREDWKTGNQTQGHQTCSSRVAWKHLFFVSNSKCFFARKNIGITFAQIHLTWSGQKHQKPSVLCCRPQIGKTLNKTLYFERSKL